MNTQTILLRLRAAGLSQTEIARLSDIPQPRLSRWESGEIPGSADDALVLAALDADISAGRAPTAKVKQKQVA